jgi:hypothetical protein
MCTEYNLRISARKTKAMTGRGKAPVRTNIMKQDALIKQKVKVKVKVKLPLPMW